MPSASVLERSIEYSHSAPPGARQTILYPKTKKQLGHLIREEGRLRRSVPSLPDNSGICPWPRAISILVSRIVS